MSQNNTKRINEIDDNSNIILKNYYVFKPYQIICQGFQADANGLFICNEGTQLDKICRVKKAFCISDWIRSLNFVSPETVATIVEEYEEKIKDLNIMIDDIQLKVKNLETEKTSKNNSSESNKNKDAKSDEKVKNTK